MCLLALAVSVDIYPQSCPPSNIDEDSREASVDVYIDMLHKE